MRANLRKLMNRNARVDSGKLEKIVHVLDQLETQPRKPRQLFETGGELPRRQTDRRAVDLKLEREA